MKPATSARTKPGPSAHGIKQQMPATCFATPSFLFAEAALPDDGAVAGKLSHASEEFVFALATHGET